METRCRLIILILTLPLALALKKSKMMTKEKSTPKVDGMDEKYYIKSSECRIRNVQQKSKHPTTKRTNIDNRECQQDDDLISTRFHDKYQRYALHINELLSQLIIEYNCSYLEIKRGTKGGVYKEVPFQDDYVVPPDVEAMLASCSNSLGEVLQTRALTFVQPRKGARSRPKRKRRKANVIMLNIGSISRRNFHKNLPELSKHLQMEGWYEMQGYGRVGPGLMPNLMAILTGYSTDTWQNLECHSKKFGCLNGLPLIFDHFKRRGYLTAYGEDVSYHNPFHFGNSSLDYYAKGIVSEAPTDCLGRLLNIRYVYEFWQQYLEQHLTRDSPLFGFFRTNSSNYDLFADGNILEPFLMEYFQRFIELGLFKHSIVILFSDGGGSHEESLLPLLFIWLPPWFRGKHPEAVQALHINSRLLTSPYDLHLTLQHILELGERWPHAVAQLQDCPKCQTLLAPMNESRTCPDVGIADATCPCDSYKPLAGSKTKQLPLGKLLVRGINDFLHQRNLQELCSNLTLKAVTGVSVRVGKEEQPPTSTHTDTYRVTFSAQPSHLEFAGTLRYNQKLQSLDYLNVGAIRRLNSYRKDSECMQKLTGKKFCVCKKPEKKPVHKLKPQKERNSIKKKAEKEQLKLKKAKRTKQKKYQRKGKPTPRRKMSVTKKEKIQKKIKKK